MRKRELPTEGFTLIELLIVVAIIAILAAIALPNFLEAQTRAKVARVKSDMRTAATALESFRVDNNGYPRMHVWNAPSARITYLYLPPTLTSPVAYLSSRMGLVDIFKPPRRFPRSQTGSTDPFFLDYLNYINTKQFDETPFTDLPYPPNPHANYAGQWEIWSWGPDRKPNEGVLIEDARVTYTLYDPTNGTVSSGDIRRTQLEVEGAGRNLPTGP